MPHWTDDLANVSDSVRQRLRNVAGATKANMQVVLIRYATERLMYRLSVSRHRDKFILKGAWLFYVWGISRRSTRDVDFLTSLPNAADEVKDIFREVVQQAVPHDDGLAYDPDSFQAEEIQLDAEHSGIRLRMIGSLGRTNIQMQIDLGFSEAVVEEPVRVVLPVLLDFEPPEIKAYSPEVVVAEKVEAIVTLGTATTRYKDFFDLYLLSVQRRFNGLSLLKQVIATFEHRGTRLPDDVPVALSDDFANSSESQRQWMAFIRRSDATDAPETFSQTVRRIRDFVYPVLQGAGRPDRNMDLEWDPTKGWVSLT